MNNALKQTLLRNKIIANTMIESIYLISECMSLEKNYVIYSCSKFTLNITQFCNNHCLFCVLATTLHLGHFMVRTGSLQRTRGKRHVVPPIN